jgi:hypothetical protein
MATRKCHCPTSDFREAQHLGSRLVFPDSRRIFLHFCVLPAYMVPSNQGYFGGQERHVRTARAWIYGLMLISRSDNLPMLLSLVLATM